MENNHPKSSIPPPSTAGISPEKFAADDFLARRPKVTIVILIALILLGGGLRVYRLGAESFGEDELNKLQTVNDYRAEGLSGRNGEHPFLMKGMQLLSVAAAEKYHEITATDRLSDEAALRLPTVLIGTLTILFLFLLMKEFFGASVGLLAAALQACDPNAVGFDRIAKEDAFLLCFFLLGNFLWVRGQTRAERGDENWTRWVWYAAIAFGAMFASKYLPHLLAVSAAYYIIFQAIPATKWRLGKSRWLKFLVLLGIAFIVFNPTILLPETWREMLKFSGEKRIGHDSYEFAGQLYRNQVTTWLAGVPWTFYYVFGLVKTPTLTFVFFLIGLPALFRRKLGDGRYFIFFWAVLWFLPFSVLGGKFTRYYTVAAPLIVIVAAIGVIFIVEQLAQKLNFSDARAAVLKIVFSGGLIVFSFAGSLSVAPHFRLFTNLIGGGERRAGFYFPHDAFYDAATAEIINAIAANEPPDSSRKISVAVETPYLYDYYAAKTGRDDLKFVSLSDQSAAANLSAGDYIVAARGRRYFSNEVYQNYLKNSVEPISEIKIGTVEAAQIYRLDERSAAEIRRLAQ